MTMKAISGVELMDSHIDLDGRGDLLVFAGADDPPFALERAFAMATCDSRAVRGGDANSCDEQPDLLTAKCPT